MPEYFDKYREFERRETNRTIDQPVVILWKCTLVELVIGFVLMIVGIYLLGSSWMLTLIFLGMALILPRLLRWMRESLPRNTFVHLFWLVGLMGNDVSNHVRRPKKFYLGP